MYFLSHKTVTVYGLCYTTAQLLQGTLDNCFCVVLKQSSVWLQFSKINECYIVDMDIEKQVATVVCRIHRHCINPGDREWFWKGMNPTLEILRSAISITLIVTEIRNHSYALLIIHFRLISISTSRAHHNFSFLRMLDLKLLSCWDNFSHPIQVHDCNHTHQLTNVCSRLSGNVNLA